MSKISTLFLTSILMVTATACTSKTKTAISGAASNSSSQATTPPSLPGPAVPPVNPTPTPNPTTCVLNSVAPPAEYQTVTLKEESFSPVAFASTGNIQQATTKLRGIGLDIQSQGWYYSRYIDRRSGFVNRSHRIDFSADPFQMSGGPDSLDLSRQDVKDAYNRRYGPAIDNQITESSCGHETSSIWWDAATWKFNTDPTAITPNPQSYDGVLTLKEKLDLVFTCDLRWINEQCAAVGSCNRDNAIEIQDSSKPCGYFQQKNWFWGYYDWYHNTSPSCRTTCP